MKTKTELMHENLLFKHLAGSHAYGTSTPTSDVDYRGVFVADPINIRTPFFPVLQAEDTSEEDTVLFELSRFMQLALKCNPNVVETLWVPDDCIVATTPAFQLLREAAPQLLTSTIGATTSGYAFGQLDRLKTSKKKVNHVPALNEIMGVIRTKASNGTLTERGAVDYFGPKAIEATGQVEWQHGATTDPFFLCRYPKESWAVVCKPKTRDYLSMVQWLGDGIIMPRDFDPRAPIWNNHRLVPYDKHTYGLYKWDGKQPWTSDGYLNDDFDGDRSTLPPPVAVLKLKFAEYTHAMNEHDKFWEWFANRNRDRLSMEQEFGFDGKHAMHLVRLLRMGVEALETGVLNVKRPDAEELLSIRRGAWTYEQVLDHAHELDAKIKGSALANTSLPSSVDLLFAANLTLQVQDMTWTK